MPNGRIDLAREVGIQMDVDVGGARVLVFRDVLRYHTAHFGESGQAVKPQIMERNLVPDACLARMVRRVAELPNKTTGWGHTPTEFVTPLQMDLSILSAAI